MGKKHSTNSGTPKKNMLQNSGDVPTALPASPMELPVKPPHHASHGQTVERQGTPAPSHTALTGIVVSGAELVTIKSTPLDWISSVATWPAMDGSDWLSFTMISILYFVLPIVMPL